MIVVIATLQVDILRGNRWVVLYGAIHDFAICFFQIQVFFSSVEVLPQVQCNFERKCCNMWDEGEYLKDTIFICVSCHLAKWHLP